MADDKNSSKQVSPVFILSDAKILQNLHSAAMQQAAKVMNIDSTSNKLDQFIINTGTTDGWTTDQYEMGIILQLNKFEIPDEVKNASSDRKLELVMKANESEFQHTKANILNGINQYFKWFSGNGDVFKDNDLVEFYPIYDNGKLKFNGIQIQGMDSKQIDQYILGKVNTLREADGDPGQDNFKPRIGYKIGYTIVR